MRSGINSPMRPTKPRSMFTRLAKGVARWSGRPSAFLLSLAVVVAWVVTGPVFDYGDTWQLTINTFTTVVTFLMVFLIQNTQYRDAEAVQVKLDELLRSTHGAHNALLDLEELEDQELDEIRSRYAELALRAREQLRRGEGDTDTPEVASQPPGSAG
jgi:low affinity Fe/Cu permease